MAISLYGLMLHCDMTALCYALLGLSARIACAVGPIDARGAQVVPCAYFTTSTSTCDESKECLLYRSKGNQD